MAEFSQANWTIIVNPAAANGKVGKIWPKLKARLATHLKSFQVVRTEYPGHAVQLVKTAVSAGCRHIIGVGGDGTNHEIVNGILQQEQLPSKAILYTLLPVGTGNDWIRTHRIPHNIEAWLNMLEEGYCIQQEVGLVRYWYEDEQKERYFVNVAGMAYDAFVVRYGEKYRKWIRNRFVYLLLILRCLFMYRLQAGVIIAAGQTIQQRFYTINVGICRFSGGGMQLVPQADPGDGLLALTYAGAVSKLGVLLNTWRFYNGSIGRHPKIELQQAKQVEVKTLNGAAEIPLEADGEFLGYSPAQFHLIEEALTVIVPRPGR